MKLARSVGRRKGEMHEHVRISKYTNRVLVTRDSLLRSGFRCLLMMIGIGVDALKGTAATTCSNSALPLSIWSGLARRLEIGADPPLIRLQATLLASPSVWENEPLGLVKPGCFRLSGGRHGTWA